MHSAPLPSNEMERLAALRKLDILDTEPEPRYDDLARIASQLCGTPIALVSFLDEQRQWFKARVGINERETARSLAFCAHAILQSDLFVVHDAAQDERFVGNPLVTSLGIRFYAGAPLEVAGGERVGTICVLDREARVLTDYEREGLMALKRQVEVLLDLRQRNADLSAARTREEILRRDKDRFVQFVAHDLKNHVCAIALGATQLESAADGDSEVGQIAAEIGDSVESLRRLVYNMLDLGRLDYEGGLHVDLIHVTPGPLVKAIARTFALRLRERGARLVAARRLDDTFVQADPALLKRVLENLVDNAIRYSPRGGAIEIDAETIEARVLLKVRDEGPGIPDEDRSVIFRMYEQGPTTKNPSGRGIGLAFCRAAIEAQRGRIWVESNAPRGSVFAIDLPAASPNG